MTSTSSQTPAIPVKGDSSRQRQGHSHDELSTSRLRSRVQTDGRLGDNEERRRAWLYLLDVTYTPTATFPASPPNGFTARPRDQLPHGRSDGPSVVQETQISISSQATDARTALQESYLRSDSEDRPAGYNSSCDETFFAGPSAEDAWKVAESKRSKRKRGRDLPPAPPTEAGVSSVFNSVVDLGDPRSNGDLGSSRAASTSRSPSSSSTSKATPVRRSSKTASPSRVVWAQTSFSDLPVDDPGGDSSQSSDLSEDEAEGAEEEETAVLNGNGNAAPSHRAVGQGVDGDPLPSDLPSEKLQTSYDEDLPEHRDEQQVEKDTRRGFNGFRLGAAWTPATLQARRRQLRDVVIGVLRRHPLLCYYQGYHDVVSVVLLVLSPNHPCGSPGNEAQSADVWASEQDFETVLLASERLSLYYLRDFMTASFEPSLGWLKVFRDTLRRTDPAFSNQVVEQVSPLPVFALSWLITAMSHTLDKDSEEVKRIFDLVLLEGPAAIVCVVVALVMQAKDRLFPDFEQSKSSEDPSELHHSFSTIPDMLSSPKLDAVNGSKGAEDGSSTSESSATDERGPSPTHRIRVEELLSTAQQLGAQLQWGMDSSVRGKGPDSAGKGPDSAGKGPDSAEKGSLSVMGPFSVLHTWSGPPACIKTQFGSAKEGVASDKARPSAATATSKAQDRTKSTKFTKGEDKAPGDESRAISAPALTPSTSRSPHAESSWASLDASTESYLSPDNSYRIVLNAMPTPPVFDDDGLHGKDDSYFGPDAGKDGKKRGERKRRQGDARMALLQRTGKVLLVGAILVGGAAIFLGSSSSSNGGNNGALRGLGGTLGSATFGLGGFQDRAQRSKLLQELSQVGRGIVGVAVCAAGAC